MQIATRTTMDGTIGFDKHPSLDGNELLQQVMEQADVDAPEVTQVRHVPFPSSIK